MVSRYQHSCAKSLLKENCVVSILCNIRFLERHSMITSRLFVDSGHCSVHSARARSSRLAQFMGSTSGKYGNPHTNAHFVRLDVFLHGKVMVQHNGVLKKVEVAYKCPTCTCACKCTLVSCTRKNQLVSLKGGPTAGQNCSSLTLPQPSIGRPWWTYGRSGSPMRARR